MPVPKVKVSRSRRNKRSANKNISMGPVAACQTCRVAVTSHSVCQNCGYYKGNKVLRTKSERMAERNQARMAQAPMPQAPEAPAEQSASE